MTTQALSVFDLFSVGIGPSSSHTVGPMRAAAAFAGRLRDVEAAAASAVRSRSVEAAAASAVRPRSVEASAASAVRRIRVDLFGSLAATGRGHGTTAAVLLGLEGADPETVDPETVSLRAETIERTGMVRLPGAADSVPVELVVRPLTVLPRHPNGMRFTAFGEDDDVLLDDTAYSVGGGFVEHENSAIGNDDARAIGVIVPMPFHSASELLATCRVNGIDIPAVMLANERALRAEAVIEAGLTRIAGVMAESVSASAARSGELPGGLAVRRRAPLWLERLGEARTVDGWLSPAGPAPERWQEWANFVALAVNEENASGGRIVTAPTNGAAGIVPAVLHHALFFGPSGAAAPDERRRIVRDFLLTAGAIGVLYKERASISGAEVGCQGEVGSAASMAAGALAQVRGGSPEQVENAAEIAMEHHLGLTCDPIGGLVQIPCIERNAIAAARAINAAEMALWGDGTHRVSLDQVIATMRETGRDMSDKYKETSLGGLAVNVPNC